MKNKLKNSYQVIVNGWVIKHGNLSLNIKQKIIIIIIIAYFL